MFADVHFLSSYQRSGLIIYSSSWVIVYIGLPHTLYFILTIKRTLRCIVHIKIGLVFSYKNFACIYKYTSRIVVSFYTAAQTARSSVPARFTTFWIETTTTHIHTTLHSCVLCTNKYIYVYKKKTPYMRDTGTILWVWGLSAWLRARPALHNSAAPSTDRILAKARRRYEPFIAACLIMLFPTRN